MSRKDIFYGGSVMQLAEEQVSEEKEPRPSQVCMTYFMGGPKSGPKV